jgi:hypothetical protein
MKQSVMTRLALVETLLHPEAAWQHTEGLCALLEAARRLPQREPFALPELEETGMGRLLREARRALGREEEEKGG